MAYQTAKTIKAHKGFTVRELLLALRDLEDMVGPDAVVLKDMKNGHDANKLLRVSVIYNRGQKCLMI